MTLVITSYHSACGTLRTKGSIEKKAARSATWKEITI